MKSNKFVYPFVPFKNLGNKKVTSVFSKRKTVSVSQINVQLSKLKTPKIIAYGQNVCDRILSVFLNSEILFGPKKYITDNKNFWINKIKYFTDKNKPIVFTLLGFPFKMPVPIKTNRTLPDMGEVLALKRLNDLIDILRAIYKPGAKIYIYGEGVFGEFNDLKKKEYKGYIAFLKLLLNKLGFSKFIEIRELDEMEKLSPDFKKQFASKEREFSRLYETKNTVFMEKYNGARPSLLKVVNTKVMTTDLNVLMDVYNSKLKHKNKVILDIRKLIEGKTHLMLIKYLSYLSVRDDLQFLEKSAPHALALSVSPKPFRLGIIPVHSKCIRLPYHGVPVFWEKKQIFTIEYLIDLLRLGKIITPVHLKGDRENLPFYYII